MAKEPQVSKDAVAGKKKPPGKASARPDEAAAAGKRAGVDLNNMTRQPILKGVKTDPPTPGAKGKVKVPAEDTPAAAAMQETMALDISPEEVAAEAAKAAAILKATPAASEMEDTMALNLSAEEVAAEAAEAAATLKAAPAPAEKGATMLGDFKLLKKLGQGGMGAVYKAHQQSLDRIVAVKVLAKELVNKKEFVERFKREAKAMAKLDHPNVLRCFEVKLDKGFHYIALEFVEGGSVEGWLKKLGRFPIGDAMHIILKTAHALQHAHENSLIHRDIKPDNLLLTKNGVVKVADLGLAKDTEEDVSLTKSGAGAGTPIYMAPEQAYNVKHVDCRVDIYALGVMLYVFLTGQPPFQGNTPIELIMAKEKGKFDPMRKYNDEVPPKLDLIVDKMLAKDAKMRYASCAEVIDELEPLGLENDQLSFLGLEQTTPVKRAVKPAPSKPPQMPAKGAPKPAAAATKSPATAAASTSVEDQVEKDVWYWNLVTQQGKIITKKVTTEQIRTLIKAGHLDAQAQVSKTAKSGFRAAATFMEFHSVFKSKETATKANVKGQKYREIYKDIEAADARKRRWGWLGKLFKGVGSTIVGLFWIALILGVCAAGGYYLFKHVLVP